jgi:hypothetical protein
MKKIIFSCAIALATLAICVDNYAGTAVKTAFRTADYVNDTVPKKDTVKKDSPAYAILTRYVNDTIPKKDTTRKDTTAFAMLTK